MDILVRPTNSDITRDVTCGNEDVRCPQTILGAVPEVLLSGRRFGAVDRGGRLCRPDANQSCGRSCSLRSLSALPAPSRWTYCARRSVRKSVRSAMCDRTRWRLIAATAVSGLSWLAFHPQERTWQNVHQRSLSTPQITTPASLRESIRHRPDSSKCACTPP